MIFNKLRFQRFLSTMRGRVFLQNKPNIFKNRLLRHFLLGLLLIHVSLVGALILRFLIAYFFAKVGTGPNYWLFIDYSLIGYRNSILPMLFIGFGIVYAQEKWSAFYPHRNVRYRRLAGLGLFYGLMIAVGIVLSRNYTFPRQTWLVAFCFSVAIYATFPMIRRLNRELGESFLYNRAWHFIIDFAIIVLAFFAAYVFRFDGLPPERFQQQFLLLFPYMILLYLSINLLWRVYAFIWRFTSLKEAIVLLFSVISSGAILLLLRILVLQNYPTICIPFGVLMAQPGLTFIGFLGVRMFRRIQYSYLVRNKSAYGQSGNIKRVLLTGAGNAGILLVRELESRPNFRIVGFLDDDRRKQGSVINGIRVLGTTRELEQVVSDKNIDEVIFCMPTAPKAVIKKLALACAAARVSTSSVPSLSEIVLGQVRIGELRPVRMEDLLGRESVEFDANDSELFSAYGGKRILVTGAAGSIGSELVRQLRTFEPSALLLLDKDENGLFEIGLEIREQYAGVVTEIMANVRDRNRLEKVFQQYKPEAILHAAAYKHVPMMEYHPAEAVLNNILGTKNVLELANEYGAQSFLLISTDKAVNPTSVMGASKRVAEMLVRHQALYGNKTTHRCAVRFGNVLGSRASVVPLFQKRIAAGKNIQVTHPEIKRYFMTIPEAVHLVIQAGSLGGHGETFVLDMGNPVKIADLAKDLIEQSGLIPGQDIEIVFTGLRPGEKLFEELLLSEESGTRSTKYPKIFIDRPIDYDWDLLERSLKELEVAARNEDFQAIYRIFGSLNIGYQRKDTKLAAIGNP
jgi:FlaA1/EpsC-like NDP-sugar epimerase